MITLKSPADKLVKNEVNLLTYLILLKFKIDGKADKKHFYENLKLFTFAKPMKPSFCNYQAAIIANAKFMNKDSDIQKSAIFEKLMFLESAT